MAAHKWIRWIVGLSGALLFSGFVGYLSDHSNATEASDSSSVQAPDDSGQEPQFGDFEKHGGRGTFGEDSGQTDPQTDGRMRTRAS